MTQTRWFIIGICIVFLVLGKVTHQDETKVEPVKTSTTVVLPTELQEMIEALCDESDDDEWYVVTTFEEVHCYSV